MSAAINDGGPAFPVGEEALMRNLTGMTLRDYFAAKAMQGLVTGFVNVVHAGRRDFLNDMVPAAYDIADAMTKARTDTTASTLAEAYAEGRKDECEALAPVLTALRFAILNYDSLTPADAERMRKVLDEAEGKS